MKKHFSFLCLFIIVFSFSQSEFITVWKPSNLNSLIQNNTPSNSNQIWFPGRGTDFSVSWEEVGYPAHNGNLSNVTSTASFLIDFGTAQNPVPANATYRIKVSNGNGIFNQFQMNDDGANAPYIFGDCRKIILVEQWGNIAWQNMNGAFQSCSNLDITATDIPNLSQVTNMESAFSGCTKLTGNATINNWNISNVTDLNSTFKSCKLFNQPLNNWNTANVTNMAFTFANATVFNQSLSNWNTANVTTMSNMFFFAENFNQSIGNWDVHNVTDMSFMFTNATNFNQPIGNWNVGNVHTFYGTFANATNFNQPIGNWNTANAVNMYCMFSDATSFNQPIGNWNTGNVITMTGMFYGATNFNQPIGNWNTANVNSIWKMFMNATSFNQPIGNWNTSSVLDMSQTFCNAVSFKQDIGNWNTSSVTNMMSMFSGATSFDHNLSNWNVSSVIYMDYMFTNATAFHQNLGTWNLNSLLSAYAMFANSGLGCQNYDLTLYGWNANPNTPNNINFEDETAMVYSNSLAVSARNNLINAKNWIISGDTYNPNCESLLGTAENNFENFGVYPNPATDFIFVKASGKIKNYSITDASGRHILEGKNSDGKIDVSKLNQGIFILKINDSKTVKFMKK